MSTLGEVVEKIVDRVNAGSAASEIFRNKSTLNVLLRDHLSMELFGTLMKKPYRTKLFFNCACTEDDSTIVIKNGDLGSTLCDCVKLVFERKLRHPEDTCSEDGSDNGIGYEAAKKLDEDWYWYINVMPGDMLKLELDEYVDVIFAGYIQSKRDEINSSREEIKVKEREIQQLEEEISQLQELAEE